MSTAKTTFLLSIHGLKYSWQSIAQTTYTNRHEEFVAADFYMCNLNSESSLHILFLLSLVLSYCKICSFVPILEWGSTMGKLHNYFMCSTFNIHKYSLNHLCFVQSFNFQTIVHQYIETESTLWPNMIQLPVEFSEYVQFDLLDTLRLITQ